MIPLGRRSTLAVVFLAAFLAVLTTEAGAGARKVSNQIEVAFGATKVAIDESLVETLVGDQKEDIKSSRDINLPKGAILTLRPPMSVSEGYSPPCKPIAAIHLIREHRMPLSENHLLKNSTLKPTAFEGIEKVIFEAGQSLDLYQFRSAELTDFYGERISFYRGADRITIELQVSAEFHVTLIAPLDDCFFEQGEGMAKRLRKFAFTSIIK